MILTGFGYSTRYFRAISGGMATLFVAMRIPPHAKGHGGKQRRHATLFDERPVGAVFEVNLRALAVLDE